MGSMNPIVVDVSSDEEPDPRVDEFKWLSEVLEAVGGKSDSFDEVEVVSDVKRVSKEKSKSSDLNMEDEYDDDCVVLDGDPEKKTAAVDTATTAVDDDVNAAECDEVVVVGQKGEIACRDFPHPRHSCAKYPFKSTLHEKYCDMCHCYVCDTRAPCPYWCIGVSSIDHCHANDKEDIWKSQREYFRNQKMPSQPVVKPPPIRAPSAMARVHPRNSSPRLIRLSPNSMPRSRVGIRACSSATRITGFSNVRSSCRMGQSRTILQNHGLQHLSVPLLNSVRNNVIQNNRGLYIGHHRPRATSSSQILESPLTSGGGFLSNLPNYTPLNDNSNMGSYCDTVKGLQDTHSSPLLAAADGWRDVSSPISMEMYTQLGDQPHDTTGYFPTVPISQSHEFTRHPGQNSTDNGSHRNQTNADVFGPPESLCSQTLQQPESNNNLQQNKILSEFEEWLMDNATVGVCSLSEPIGPDEGSLTFDFETFLKN